VHSRVALTLANCRLLIGPAVAGGIYLIWALLLARSKKMNRRQKGERLMLMGLFWLFAYDASMLLSNGQYVASISITLLLLCAIMSFFTIRWLSRRMQLGHVGYRADRLPEPRLQKIP